MFRDAEISRILMALNDGKSILITGIRRTGKTSVVREVLTRQENESPVKYLDVQDYISLEAFYRDILEQMPHGVVEKLINKLARAHLIPDRLFKWLGQRINKVTTEGAEVDFNPPDGSLLRYWEVLVDQLTDILKKFPPKKIAVIGIDELPFMLENLLDRGTNIEDLIIALASLRKLRDSGLRIIITGSISMENLLSIHGIPHTVLGGLWRELIPPFTKSEAWTYLHSNLSGKFAQNSEVLDIVLDKIPDYIPEFLYFCVTHLSLCSDIEACKNSINKEVLPKIRRSFLYQFDERLIKNYNEEELKVAEDILDIIARGGHEGSKIDGSKLSGGYKKVLVKLQFDNFIIDGANFNWRFTLQLLKQWWSASRGIV